MRGAGLPHPPRRWGVRGSFSATSRSKHLRIGPRHLALASWLGLAVLAPPGLAGDEPVRNRPGLDGIVEYVMACRTGRGLTVREFRDTVGDNTVYPIFVIDFQRASAAATAASPAHGECAWMDRPIAAEEPSVLVFHTGMYGWAFPDRFSRDYGPNYRGTVMLREWADLRAALAMRRTIFYVHAFRATRPFDVDFRDGSRPIDLGTNYFEISRINDVVVARRP